jgi:hypothetical protein
MILLAWDLLYRSHDLGGMVVFENEQWFWAGSSLNVSFYD